MDGDGQLETIGGAIRGVLNDPRWTGRVAVGALVNLIPYVGAVWVMGYSLHYQRGLAWRISDRLPEWKSAGEHLRTGLYAFVVGMVYSLPFSAVLGVVIALALMGVITTGVLSPEPGPAYLLTILGISFLTLLLLLPITVMLHPVYAHVALYNSLEAGFDWRTILGLVRANSRAFWTTAGRSAGVMLLSLLLSFGVTGVLAAAAGSAMTGRGDDIGSLLLPILILPVQLVIVFAMGLFGVFFGLVNYRIWAGYARIAYGLYSAPATAPEQPSMPAS